MNEKTIPRAWESLMNSADFVPVIVRSVERFMDTSWSQETNRHDSFELVYIKKGNAIFEIAGIPVDIGPNEIIIIKPQQPHKVTVKSNQGCEFAVFNFKFESKINRKISEVSISDFINFVSNKESGPFITLKVSSKNDIIVLIERILKEKEKDEIGKDFLNYLMMLELFVLISRAMKMEWENSIKGKSSKLKEVIQAAINYININYERDISLKDIAKYVFLSPSYFAKAFKDETGKSPISYLIQIRLDRAKELLAESEQKVYEIAVSVGFSNQQRFNEIFKKYTGMTPLQYRKQQKKH
ncbi:MAG: AraC family transcriptional regulator [Clostridiaceae bacterium]|jgi:AraC-like DNA-binding protein|nr:AraC family transcriptional regulator [Clostridiaceae bacterium]